MQTQLIIICLVDNLLNYKKSIDEYITMMMKRTIEMIKKLINN